MTDITKLPTSIELDFADGRYWFALTWPLLLELERKCGAKDHDGIARDKSVFSMHSQLGAGLIVAPDGEVMFTGGSEGLARDIAHIIRLGLIGGNRATVMGEKNTVSPSEAHALVDAYVYPAAPLVESAAIAFAILNAVIHGNPKPVDEPEVESN